MNDNILITGGSGLLALSWAFTIRDRHAVTLGLHKRRVSPPGVATRYFSLDSVDAIIETFGEIRPQLVVHTAGLTNVEECEANPLLARHVNVELTENVAKACFQTGVRLVHISTDHLFAGDRAFVDESQPTAPRNVYAQTKGEAESRVLNVCPGALVVRTNFYGWGPSFRRSFSDSIIAPLRSGERVTLFEDVFYTPILIEKLVHAAHTLVSRKASGIFHVVGDQRISKYEFGLEVAKLFHLDSNLIRRGSLADHAALARRPRDMSLSNEKTRTLLNTTLGGVDEHIATLYEQERSGLAREIRNL